MTKKEYMKKLAYQLRRLPKEDFDKAMDYFEEYFEDAGIENEQKAIEDLGGRSGFRTDSGSGTGKCCQTAKNNETALFCFMDRCSGTFCCPDRPASDTWDSGRDRSCHSGNPGSRWRYLNFRTCRNSRKRTRHYRRDCNYPSDLWRRTGHHRSLSDADRMRHSGDIFHHITCPLVDRQTCRTARQTCEKRRKKT